MKRKKEEASMLTKEQKKKAVEHIQFYIQEHLEVEIGNLQSEMFLDYLTEKIGIYYYNKGIADAMGYMAERTEDMYLLMKDEY